jgi:hypothetical protein
MNRVNRFDAAGSSLIPWLAASMALLAGAGVVCAQAPGRTASEGRTAASAIPAIPASTVPSSTGTKSGYAGFVLPQAQFPALGSINFQSFRSFQGGEIGYLGDGRRPIESGRFGSASLPGSTAISGFGLQVGGAGPNTAPNFNQMMRANAALPFASSAGAFKLTYRNGLIPGINGGNLEQETPGVIFGTTNLGNGVFFSAGTNVGRSSMAGTPPGGNAGATGPKPSRPAVALKLSF